LVSEDIGPDLIVSPSGVLYTNSSGVSRSYDQGETWEAANSGLLNEWGEIVPVISIACDQEGLLYAGTIHGTESEAGVYVSQDGGDSWVFHDIAPTNYMEYCELEVNEDGHVYLGSNDMLKMSTDNGESWEDLNAISAPSGVNCITFDTNGILYAAPRWDMGVYRTTDNTQTWELITEDEVSSIGVNENNHLFIGTEFGGMKRSSDGGSSWEAINSGLPFQQLSFILSNNNTIFTAGYSPYRSTNNGDHWEEKAEGLIISNISSITVDTDGSIYALTDKIWRSDDKGSSWIDISDTVSWNYTKIVAHNNEIYLSVNSFFSGRLLKSSNNGETWEQLSIFDGKITDFEFNSNGKIFAITALSGIYKSSDGGYSWTITNFPQSDYTDISISINRTILASQSYAPFYVYRSDDEGVSSTQTYTDSPWNAVRRIVAGKEDTFFIESNGKLFRSQDNGFTWSNVTELFPGNPFLRIVETDYKGILYAGDFNDFYRSTDFGLTWSTFNSGSPELPGVQSFTSSEKNGILYAGTISKGVWANGIYVDVQNHYITSSISAYPNPASEFITIDYPSFKPGIPAIASIYNVQGSLLRTIQLQGVNNRISLQGLNSGLYLISVNDVNTIKVMVK
jgi:photosystem II stability/assembly factor-like uncharacterized protein